MPTQPVQLVLAPGVIAVNGARVDARAVAFLVAVRSRLPADFPPIIVTSGQRTPPEQASAMLKKFNYAGAAGLLAAPAYGRRFAPVLNNPEITAIAWGAKISELLDSDPASWTDAIQQGAMTIGLAAFKEFSHLGAVELLAIYGPKANRLLALPRTVPDWTEGITRALAEGVSFSAHLRADALDIRRHDDRGAMWPRAQLDTLISAIKRTGAQTLVEDNPPHLHVDHIPADAKPAEPTVSVNAAIASSSPSSATAVMPLGPRGPSVKGGGGVLLLLLALGAMGTGGRDGS